MKKLLAMTLAVVMMLGCVSMFASCGEKESLNFGKELLAVDSQLDALVGLTKGDADIAIIDSIMAGYYMNTGDTYADYQILNGVVLAEEEYGIGAKKGNDALIGKINEALIALATSGGLKLVSDQYGLSSEVLVKNDTANPKAEATDNSWNDIVTDGKLVIGYTLFAPIAYNEGDALIGFDIDLAKATVAYLNLTYGASVEVDFQVIEWNQKEALLETGTIDLVWNGMTLTPERSENMAMSVPYLANKQVAIAKKADAANYGANKDEFVEKVADCVIIVEKGSAGEELVKPVE